ncbi:MAG: Nudix family hydrolase [Gammaproteobacteria bacterium]|nr:Nudix family hydrolase [Gammaproteobacteria bacterium]
MLSQAIVHVAVAVIERDGKILIAKRPDHLHQGGLWEFPGGKLESEESVIDALKREIREELSITITEYHPLIRIEHDYGDRRVLLDTWRVTEFESEARGNEGQKIAWVGRDKLSDYDFPEANDALLTAARLPHHYLITPQLESEASLLKGLKRSLEQGVRLVQLRAKHLNSDDYIAIARKALALCRGYGARLMLNAGADCLTEVPADGIHLNTAALLACQTRPKGIPLVAASCHNETEIEHANRIGVDFIVISPVMNTTSHPQAEPIGWDGLLKLTQCARIPAYALGGMKREDITRAWKHGAQGIAAIQGLWST